MLSSLQLCPGKSQCVATESAVSTIRTVDSIRQVTSAVSCMCMPRERRCRLRSHLQVFHKGTRFEKSINVGECVGRCKGEKTQIFDNPQCFLLLKMPKYQLKQFRDLKVCLYSFHVYHSSCYNYLNIFFDILGKPCPS